MNKHLTTFKTGGIPMLLLLMSLLSPFIKAASNEQWNSMPINDMSNWKLIEDVKANSISNIVFEGDLGAIGDLAGAIWYTQNIKNTRGMKIVFTPEIGIDLTFDGNMKFPQGFALVFTSNPIDKSGPIGKKASGLGYDGIPNGIAIEFDFIYQKDRNDARFPHCSVHCGLTDKLSSISHKPSETKFQNIENQPFPNFYDPTDENYFSGIQIIVEIIGNNLEIYTSQGETILKYDASSTSGDPLIPFLQLMENDEVYFGITASMNRLKSVTIKDLELLQIAESNSISLALDPSSKLEAGNPTDFQIKLTSKIGTVLKIFPQQFENIIFKIEGNVRDDVSYFYDDSKGLIATVKNLNSKGYYTAVAEVEGKTTNSLSFSMNAGSGTRVDLCNGTTYDSSTFSMNGVIKNEDSFTFYICSYDNFNNTKSLTSRIGLISVNYPNNFASSKTIEIAADSSQETFKITVPITSTGRYEIFSKYFVENLFRFYEISESISKEKSLAFLDGLTKKYKKNTAVSLRLNVKNQLGLEMTQTMLEKLSCSFADSKVMDSTGNQYGVSETKKDTYVLLSFTHSNEGKYTFLPKFKCGDEQVSELNCEDCSFYYLSESSSNSEFMIFSDFQDDYIKASTSSSNIIYLSLDESNLKLTSIYPVDSSGYKTVFTETEITQLSVDSQISGIQFNAQFNKFGFIDIFYQGKPRKEIFDQFTSYDLTVNFRKGSTNISLTITLKFLFKDDFMNNIKVTSSQSTEFVAFFKPTTFTFEVGKSLYLFDLYGKNSNSFTNGNDLDCAKVTIKATSSKEETLILNCQKLSHFLAINAELKKSGETKIQLYYDSNPISSLDAIIKPSSQANSFDYKELNKEGTYTENIQGDLTSITVEKDVNQIPFFKVRLLDEYGNYITEKVREIFDIMSKTYSDDEDNFKKIKTNIEENGIITIYDDSHSLTETYLELKLPSSSTTFSITFIKNSNIIDPSNSFCNLTSLELAEGETTGQYNYEVTLTIKDFYGNTINLAEESLDLFTVAAVKSDNSLLVKAAKSEDSNVFAPKFTGTLEKTGEYKLECFYKNTPLQILGKYFNTTPYQNEDIIPKLKVYYLDYKEKMPVFESIQYAAIVKKSKKFNIKIEHSDEYDNPILDVNEHYSLRLYSNENDTQFKPINFDVVDSQDRKETKYLFQISEQTMLGIPKGIYYTIIKNGYYYFNFIEDDQYSSITSNNLDLDKSTILMEEQTNICNGKIDMPCVFGIDLRDSNYQRFNDLDLTKFKIECLDCQSGITLQSNFAFVEDGLVNAIVLSSKPGQFKIQVSYSDQKLNGDYYLTITAGKPNQFEMLPDMDYYYNGNFVYLQLNDVHGTHCGLNILNTFEYNSQIVKVTTSDNRLVYNNVYYNSLTGILAVEIDPKVSGTLNLAVNLMDGSSQKEVTIKSQFKSIENLYLKVDSSSLPILKLNIIKLNDERQEVNELTNFDQTLLNFALLNTQNDRLEYIEGKSEVQSWNISLNKEGDYLVTASYSGIPLYCENCRLIYKTNSQIDLTRSKVKIYIKEGINTWLEKGEEMTRGFFKHNFPVFKLNFYSEAGNLIDTSSTTYTIKMLAGSKELSFSHYISKNGDVIAYLNEDQRSVYNSFGELQSARLQILSGSGSTLKTIEGFYILNSYSINDISNEQCIADAIPRIYNKESKYLLRAGNEISLEFSLQGCIPQTQQFFDESQFNFGTTDSEIKRKIIPSSVYGQYILFISSEKAKEYQIQFKFKNSEFVNFDVLIYPSYQIREYTFTPAEQVNKDANYFYFKFQIFDIFGNEWNNLGISSRLYNDIPLTIQGNYYPHIKVAFAEDLNSFNYLAQIEAVRNGFVVLDPWKSGNKLEYTKADTQDIFSLVHNSYVTISKSNNDYTVKVSLVDDVNNSLTKFEGNSLKDSFKFYYTTYDGSINVMYKTNKIEASYNDADLSFSFTLENLPEYEYISIIPYMEGYQIKCVDCKFKNKSPNIYTFFNHEYHRITQSENYIIEHSLHAPLIFTETNDVEMSESEYKINKIEISLMSKRMYYLGYNNLDTLTQKLNNQVTKKLTIQSQEFNLIIRPKVVITQTEDVSKIKILYSHPSINYLAGDSLGYYIEFRDTTTNDLYDYSSVELVYDSELSFAFLSETSTKGVYYLILPSDKILALDKINFKFPECTNYPLYIYGQSQVPISITLKNQNDLPSLGISFEIEANDINGNSACNEKQNLYLVHSINQPIKQIAFNPSSQNKCIVNLQFFGKSSLRSKCEKLMDVALETKGTTISLFKTVTKIKDNGLIIPDKSFTISLTIYDNYGIDISSSILDNLKLVVYEYESPTISRLVYTSKNYYSNQIAIENPSLLGMTVGKKYFIIPYINNGATTSINSANVQYDVTSFEADKIAVTVIYDDSNSEDISDLIVTKEYLIDTIRLTLEYPIQFTVSFLNGNNYMIKAPDELNVGLYENIKSSGTLGEEIMQFKAIKKDDYYYAVFLDKEKINQFIHLSTGEYMIKFAYKTTKEDKVLYLQFNKNGIYQNQILVGEYQYDKNIKDIDSDFDIVYQVVDQLLTVFAGEYTKSTICFASNHLVYNEHLDTSKISFATEIGKGCQHQISETYRGCIDLYLKCSEYHTSSGESLSVKMKYNAFNSNDLRIRINPPIPSTITLTNISKFPQQVTLKATAEQIRTSFKMASFISVNEDSFKVSINGVEVDRSYISTGITSDLISISISTAALKYSTKTTTIKVYFQNGYDSLQELTGLETDISLIQEKFESVNLVLPQGYRAGEEIDVFLIFTDVNGYCYEGDVNIEDYNLRIKGLIDKQTDYTFYFERKDIADFEKCRTIYKMYDKEKQISDIKIAGEYTVYPSFDQQNTYSITVYSNELDTSNAVVVKEPKGSSSAGDTFKLKITGNDPYGNQVNIYEVSDKFDIQLENQEKQIDYTFNKYVETIDEENSIIVFEFTVTTTGTHKITYKYDGSEITPTTTEFEAEVIPGQCIYSDNKSYVTIDPNKDLVPGSLINIQVVCKDKYENTITKAGSSNFTIEVRRITESEEMNDDYELPTTFDPLNQNFTATTILPYEGIYQLNVKLNADARNYGEIDGITLEVKSIACDEENPYICVDNQCYNEIKKCNIYFDKETQYCSEDERAKEKFFYEDGTCKSVDELNPPYDYQKCDGAFIPVQARCYSTDPIRSSCYNKLLALYPDDEINVCDDGSCRINQPCPRHKIGCPIGYIPCGTKCIRNEERCSIDLCQEGEITCWDMSCAKTIEECPTKMSCPNEGDFICQDQTCASDRYKCKQPQKCREGEYLCDDFSCKPSKEDCSKKPVCPIGYSLCPNGQCQIGCNESSKCQEGEVLCPNGECADKLTSCATPIYCPNNYIKCSQGGCAKSLDLCKNVQGNNLITCPISKPILCPNLMCTDNAKECLYGLMPQCPEFAPFLCWNNECRKDESQCPSKISCPKNYKTLCNDLTCSNGVHHCREVDESDKNINKFRCANGRWVDNQMLCPSMVTCPEGTVRCPSGSCVLDVEQCQERVECPDPNHPYRCPDETCRESKDACSSISTCPLHKPVKCYDNSCRADISACPVYQECGGTLVSCPDGSCSSSYEKCNTIVSCPKGKPFLCPDMTCKERLDDCAEPVDDCNGKFSCYSGHCVSNRQLCKTFEGCLSENPIKCSSNTCTNKIANCDATEKSCPIGYTKCTNGECKTSEIYCNDFECPPNKPYLCQEGVCAPSKEYCDLENGCPYNRPFKCKFGKCVKDSNSCDPDFDYEVKDDELVCPDGSVVKKESGNCPLANGCYADKPFKCADGTCINPNTHECTPVKCSFEFPIQCPNGQCVETQSRCYSTIRDIDKLTCVLSEDKNGEKTMGFYCANGRCVESFEQCRPLFQCENNLQLCGDGTCRSSLQLCPKENYCPIERGFIDDYGQCFQDTEGANKICPSGFIQCSYGGHCYTEEPDELLNWIKLGADMEKCEDIIKPNGCPLDNPYKCLDGRCLQDEKQCNSINPACSIETPYLCSNGKCAINITECQDGDENGCEEGLVPCKDGKCVSDLKECLNNMGCPETKPFRCSNGDCVEDGSKCSINVYCDEANPILCADNSCVPKAEYCKIVYPCGYNNGTDYLFNKTFTCKNRLGVCVEEEKKEQCETIEKMCPKSSPIKCPNGKCVTDYLFCPDFTIKAHCKSDEFYCTRKGECVNSINKCFTPDEVAGKSIISRRNLQIKEGESENGCPLETPYSCYDGTCVSDRSICPNIPSCGVMKFRCPNGVCKDTLEDCEKASEDLLECQPGLQRCEDGLCRENCPSYNGCPIGQLLCPNGVCAFSDEECIGYSMCENPSTPYRCMTGDCVDVPSLCVDVMRIYEVPLIKTSFYKYDESKINFAYDASRRPAGYLTISPSSVEMINGLDYGEIEIRNMPHSELYNPNYYNNSKEFLYNVSKGIDGSDGILGLENSVLSPVIEINSADVNVNFIRPAKLHLEFNSYSKKTSEFLFSDYCLGKLETNKNTGVKRWECVNRCNSEENDQFSINSLGIYAIILNPSRQHVKISDNGNKNFFFENIKTLLIVAVIIIFVAAIGYYIFNRVTRYRAKYIENKRKIIMLKDQKKDYENQTTDVFGQTLGDNILGLVYTKNPSFDVDKSAVKESQSLEEKIESLKMQIKNVNRQNKGLEEQVKEYEKKFDKLNNKK